jgi:hypothetical protein
MFKSILIKTALASMMIGSLGASANTTVDLFSDDQVYQTVQGGSTYNDATGPDIIGGQRDILITAGSNVRASTDVAGNELKIASNVSTTGATAANTEFTVEVQWDGVDSTSDTSLLDLTPGITPVADFSTLNGFSATINQSDGAGFFEIFLYNSDPDLTNNMTTVLLPFNPVTLGSPVTFSIPFAYFVPEIDLTEIIAIVLKMTSIGNTDINVASISAVPAPSSLAVLGLGLLAFTGFARRKA